jgi:cell division protein FtsQ
MTVHAPRRRRTPLRVGCSRLAGASGRLRRRLRRARKRTLAAVAVALVALLAGGWLWLRDSSLVAISSVRVVGVSGRDAAQIEAALTSAARRMTTLDLSRNRLLAAVSAYPQVVGLRVSTELPHGLRILVLERIPVAVLDAAGQRAVVDTDGQLLPGASPRGLPVVPLGSLPSGRYATPGHGLAEVRLLAAAPWQLIGRIASAGRRPRHGLVVALRHGPLVYFGTDAQAAAKWRALVAVLASGRADGASYIDVSDPNQPTAGPGSAASAAGTAGGANASTPGSAAGGSSTTPATTTPATTTPATTTPAVTTPATTTPAGTSTPQTATLPAGGAAGASTPASTTP